MKLFGAIEIGPCEQEAGSADLGVDEGWATGIVFQEWMELRSRPMPRDKK
jgi:hypothetical protein